MKKLLLVPIFSAALLTTAQAPHTLMDSIMHNLENVFKTDQQYRTPLEATLKKYGINSPQVDSLEEHMAIQDSINLGIVTHILDTYGWISRDSIGEQGNFLFFLVIQHSDLGVQEKYLPMMRDAVKKGNAKARDLAYLEDRVALGEGKKQLYGTQLQFDSKTNKYAFAPIEDEPNVDKRRAAVGLEPLAEYARSAGFDYHLPPQSTLPPPPSPPPPPLSDTTRPRHQ